MKNILIPNRGYDVTITIDGIDAGGQSNASLAQTAAPIDITNQIDNAWGDSLQGTKKWQVTCGSFVIKNEEAFKQLQSAFDEGKKVDITIADDNIEYSGKAIITSFPIVINYNTVYTYSLVFQGCGKLERTILVKNNL